TKAEIVEQVNPGITVDLKKSSGDTQRITVDKVLVAVGRTPNTEELGIENIGIQTENGFIPVGDYYQTKVPSIFAIGDVINSPLLAHVASKEGEICVEFIAGKEPEKRIDPCIIPAAVYCEPEIASFGFTEDAAKSKGIDYKTSNFPFRANGRAVASEESEGFIKVLYSPESREILGAHIIGPCATEMIHEILLAKKCELLPEDIAALIHAHPTLSESVMESMRMAEGWAIHI
ncbi:MAG: FAD-dependent oxidoreductase, partial [bacterium]